MAQSPKPETRGGQQSLGSKKEKLQEQIVGRGFRVERMSPHGGPVRGHHDPGHEICNAQHGPQSQILTEDWRK